MSESGLRFSLRNLFMAMTLVATLVASAAHYPVVLVASLILVSPLLFIAAMVHLHNQGIRDDAHREISKRSSH